MTAAPASTVAPTSASTSGVVVGDGTTTATRVRSRWRRARWPLAVLGLIVLVALLAALPEPRTSSERLAPDNPDDDGARAIAQILGRQGVEVTYVRTSAEAVEAATAGSTLLITADFLLTPEQLDAVARTSADLVLVAPGWTLDVLAPSVTWAGTPADDDVLRAPDCSDPDAVAAEKIRSGGSGFLALDTTATVCFPATAPGSGGAYVVTDAGERRVTAIDDGRLLTNEYLAEDGNAALGLRMLGRHDRLTWWVPSLSDPGLATGAGSPSLSDLLPPSAGLVALQLLVVAVLLALWRARRLGRVVAEPLPVVVRSGEVTRGRGRLYRRSRSYGHAAAALRAGAAARSAARIGLPRSAGPADVIDALARATGRSTDEVAHLLYGPPPTDDTGLATLARRLDELESEVHRS